MKSLPGLPVAKALEKLHSQLERAESRRKEAVQELAQVRKELQRTKAEAVSVCVVL